MIANFLRSNFNLNSNERLKQGQILFEGLVSFGTYEQKFDLERCDVHQVQKLLELCKPEFKALRKAKTL